ADGIVAEGSFVAQHRIGRPAGQRTAFDPGIGRLNQTLPALAKKIRGQKEQREEKVHSLHRFHPKEARAEEGRTSAGYSRRGRASSQTGKGWNVGSRSSEVTIS